VGRLLVSGKVRRSRVFVLLRMPALLAVTVPAAAQRAPLDSTTLSVSDRARRTTLRDDVDPDDALRELLVGHTVPADI
jgi:hypothetical protein